MRSQTLGFLVVAAVVGEACGTSPSAPTTVTRYVFTLTGTTFCRPVVPDQMEFSLTETTAPSTDGRVFHLVADRNWTPFGATPLALELSKAAGNVIGRLTGSASRDPNRLNWLAFSGDLTGASAATGRFNGTIVFNQISPDPFSVACAASDMDWTLVKTQVTP